MASALLVRSVVAHAARADRRQRRSGVVAATVQLPAGAYAAGRASIRRIDVAALDAPHASPASTPPAPRRCCRSIRAGACRSDVDGRAAQAGDYARRAAHLHQQRLLRDGRRLAGGRPRLRRHAIAPTPSRSSSSTRRSPGACFPARMPLGKRLVSTARNIGPLGINVVGAGPVPHRRRRRRHPSGAARSGGRAGHLSHDPAVPVPADDDRGARRGRRDRRRRRCARRCARSIRRCRSAIRKTLDARLRDADGGAAAADVRARRASRC